MLHNKKCLKKNKRKKVSFFLLFCYNESKIGDGMKNKGFTLVELLVTIVILGIMMGLSFPVIRYIQEENNRKKYETYAEGMMVSARLYVDSYDEDLFGHHDTGCAYITYDELVERNLLEDVPISNISCDSNNTFVRVVKLRNQYGYSYSLGCGKKGTDKVENPTVLLPKESAPTLDRRVCRGRDGANIAVTLTKEDGVFRKKRSTVILESPTGIHANVVIYATWIKGEERPNDSSKWSRVNFDIPRKQEETILGGDIIQVESSDIISPAGDGAYYLWIRIDELKDMFGEEWKNEDYPEDGKYLHVGPFHLDNTPPICTYSGEVEENAWSKGSRTITIGCRDEGEGASGCKPGKNEKTFIFSESVSKGTASYTIYDVAGNRKKCERSDLKVYIDNTAPTCTLTGPSTVWTNGNRTITWGCDDKHSGCAVGYSGGSKVFSTTTETANIASYEIRDKVGNKTTCTAQKDVMVRVDKEAPNCTNDGDSTSWTGSNRTITWGCVDNEKPANLQSGCATGYSGSSRTYSTTTRTASIGGYTIRDKAGNQRSCSERTANVYVDKTDPTCTKVSDITDIRANQRTIKYSCSDGESGCTTSGKDFSIAADAAAPSYSVSDRVGNKTNCATGTSTITNNTFTVTFNCNGGSGGPGPQSATYGSKFTLTSAVCTREGYTQNGWTDSSGTVWTTANTNNWKWNRNNDVVLTARWSAKTYSVNFNCNGGSGTPANQTATYDQAFTLTSATCTRSGYNQNGWSENKDGTGTTWTTANTKNWKWTYTKNVTLYAKWVQKCPYNPGETWTYFYTGTLGTFTVPCSGKYKIEAIGGGGEGGSATGAFGGNDNAKGPKAGYATGTMNFEKGENVYYAVGGCCASAGGYNGGGQAYADNYPGNPDPGAGGGGATHAALNQRALLKNTTKTNVLLVAGGSGGNKNCSSGNGYGGGTSGGNGGGKGGSSSAGGAGYNGGGNGSYGQGGSGNGTWGGAGGGGGWYGGGGAAMNSMGAANTCGGGGSSYVSSKMSNGSTSPNVSGEQQIKFTLMSID